MNNERVGRMKELAKEAGFDMDNLSVVDILRGLLTPIADGPIDSGGSACSADLWVSIGGVEYFVSVRKSNNQIAKENRSGTKLVPAASDGKDH